MMSDLSSSSTAAPRHPELATVDFSAVVLPSANDHTSILHTTHVSDADAVPSAAASVLARKQEQQLRHEALRALVSERYIVEWTPEEDERIDPLERAVRCLVPIPKQYYWDVVVPDPEDWSAIPTHIKVWHRLISGSVAVGEWTNSHVAQPVASALGLTSSRFHFVTDHMTVQEMEQSRRMVQERKLRNQEMQEGDAV